MLVVFPSRASIWVPYKGAQIGLLQKRRVVLLLLLEQDRYTDLGSLGGREVTRQELQPAAAHLETQNSRNGQFPTNLATELDCSCS